MVSAKFFKDIIKYLPTNIIPIIMGFILIPVASRLFLPGVYGKYALAMASVTAMLVFINLIISSVIRFYPAYEKEARLDEFTSTITISFLLYITGICLFFLCLLFFARFFISEILCKLFLSAILLFALKAAYSFLLSFLRARRQLNSYAVFSVYNSVFSVTFGLILVVIFNTGVGGLIWGAVIAIALSMPFLWMTVKRRDFLAKGFSSDIFLEIFRYGFPLVLSGFAAWLINLSDRYLLAFFKSDYQVGIYSASYAIASMGIMVFASLFHLAERPIAMEVWENHGKEKSCECVSKLTRYYLIVCLPIAVGLSVLARPVIHTLVAHGYRLGYRIVPFVVFAYFFMGLANRFHLPLIFFKNTKLIMFCTVAAGLSNIMLNIILLPRYGYIAAGITTFIAYGVYLLLSILTSRKFLIWDFSFFSLGRIAAASSIVGIALYYIGNNRYLPAWISLLIALFAGAVIYPAALFLTGELNKRDIISFANIFFKD